MGVSTVRKIKSKLNLNSSPYPAAAMLVLSIRTEEHTIRSMELLHREITWNYSYKELLDLSAGTEIIYNDVTRYSLQKQQNLQYWNQHYTFEINLYLPKGFSFASDIDYTTRSGLTQGYNLWMLFYLMQVLPNRYLQIRRENSGCRYTIYWARILALAATVTRIIIEDASYNVLKRFWQLSFTYNNQPLSRVKILRLPAAGTVISR